MGHRTAVAKGRYIRAHRRDSGKTPEEIADLGRDLLAAKVEDYLEKVLVELTVDQRSHLAAVLAP